MKYKEKFIHISFEIGLLIKTIDGFLEIIGALLLLFISPNEIQVLVKIITQHELAENPNNFIVKGLLMLSKNYSVSVQYFSAFYLFSHGIIKILIMYLLNKRKYWAFPLSIIFLISFIAYQLYRYSYSHSFWLIILTIFDLIMVFLTYNEYQNIIRTKQKFVIRK